jgi:hypothetical protein
MSARRAVNRPQVCNSCGSENNFLRDSSGYYICRECGTQANYVEQVNEFSSANVAGGTGRGRRTIKRLTVTKTAAINSADPLQVAVSDSKLFLVLFNFLLQRQAKILIKQYKVQPLLMYLVGRIWLAYLQWWRSEGWGDEEISMKLTNIKLGQRRRPKRKDEPLQVDLTQDDQGTNSIKPRQNRYDENSAEEMMEQKYGGNTAENFSRKSQSNKGKDKQNNDAEGTQDELRQRRKHKGTLAVGELSMPLSLAILYLALQLLREPFTAQNLVHYAEYGLIPYRNIINVTYLPRRIYETAQSRHDLVMFFSPSTVAGAFPILSLANFIATKVKLAEFLALPANTQQPPAKAAKFNTNRVIIGDSARNFHLFGELFNAEGVMYALIGELQLPKTLSPLCFELLRAYRSIEIRDRVDELALSCLIIMTLKLVYGLDERADQLFMNKLHPEYRGGQESNGNNPRQRNNQLSEAEFTLRQDHSNFLGNIVAEIKEKSAENGEEEQYSSESPQDQPVRPSIFALRNIIPANSHSVHLMAPEFQQDFMNFLDSQAFFNFSVPADFEIYTEIIEQIAKDKPQRRNNAGNRSKLQPERFWARLAPLLDQHFTENREFPFERMTVYSPVQDGYFHHSYNYVLLMFSTILALPLQQIHEETGRIIQLLYDKSPALPQFSGTLVQFKRLFLKKKEEKRRHRKGKKRKTKRSRSVQNDAENEEESEEQEEEEGREEEIPVEDVESSMSEKIQKIVEMSDEELPSSHPNEVPLSPEY